MVVIRKSKNWNSNNVQKIGALQCEQHNIRHSSDQHCIPAMRHDYIFYLQRISKVNLTFIQIAHNFTPISSPLPPFSPPPPESFQSLIQKP